MRRSLYLARIDNDSDSAIDLMLHRVTSIGVEQPAHLRARPVGVGSHAQPAWNP